MTGKKDGWRVLAIAAVVLGASLVPLPAAAQSVAITPVTVIDVREGEALPDRTVLVEGDRIAAVGPVGSVEIPSGARVVDGTGKFLIPGLWDMHAHTMSIPIARDILFPLFIANGVTGIRTMKTDCFESEQPDCIQEAIREGFADPLPSIYDVKRWREEIEAGTLVGPRIVAGSAMLDGTEPNKPSTVDASTPFKPATAEHAREHARILEERGVDFAKIYNFIPRDAYFAFADEANRLGLPFAGHVPVGVKASEASEAGQRSIEHAGFTNVAEECSTREDEIRRRLRAELESDEPQIIPIWLDMVESYDAAKCARVYETFIKNGTWVTPTLVAGERLPVDWREDPRLRYVPREEREFWGGMEEDFDRVVENPEHEQALAQFERDITLAQHQAGVPLLAGADAPAPGVLAGFGLHDELEILVAIGLTEAEALRTATLEPARYLEAEASMGTVEQGKLADLVLLEANPLEDISHTQEIAAVVLDGRYLDRAALDELLEEAEQAASRPQEAAPDGGSDKDRSPAGKLPSDTVHVAPPTGETEVDRTSVQAAFDAVQPGGTVLFSPGTYLLGAGAKLTVPDVTVVGHPDGTVLRGCDPEAFTSDASEEVQIAFECTGLYIQAERQTIRGLTFEYTWHGIVVGPYPTTVEEATALRESGESPCVYPAGGQRIEGNTFRATPNGLRVLGSGNERSVVRDNDFIDVFHAIGIYGAPLHFLDNRVTVAEPGRVPFSRHPGSAIIVSPGHTDCAGHVVARNRIEGYPDPIYVLVRRGETCHGVEIRDNTIHAARVKIPEAWIGGTPTVEDSTMVGTPITLMNRTEPTPGPPEADREGILEDILVEGNHIAGAEGLGILVQDVSRSRFAGNTIAGIQRRDPFPGMTWDGFEPRWEAANGSAIWVSPGSDENQIVGNTFEDVAGAAVFLEGDRNRVTLRSASDSVRDLGRGNEVSATDSAGASARSYWRPLASPDRASARLSRSPDGTLFAGTRAGLFASEDLGRSWHLKGSANRNLGPPLVTPEGALLAGSYRQGVLRSTDGGHTWTSVGFERNIYTGSLVRDREGRIYARARGAVEDEPTGIFRSDDDGRTWTAAGLADEEVYDASIPRPGVLFAGTENGLFRSEDGGDTWSPAGELPSGAPVSEVMAYGGDLFASMGAPLWRIPGGGVARSPDAGDTWEPTEGLPAEAAVQDLAVHGGTLFAAVGDLRRDEGRGLYRLDAGGRWRPSGLGDVRLLSLLSTPDGLFAGARELGVFRSEDGRSWTRRSEGFRNWAVVALAVGADGTLYGLTPRDLFRSADRGSTWTSNARPEGSALPTPSSLIVSSEGRLLLAGEGGVLVSDDGGAAWERRPIPGEEGEVFALSAGPGGEVFAVVRREAAYVSPDEGRSWRRLDLPGAPVQALFSSSRGTRFVTTSEGFHRRSGDGSWEEVSGEHVWALTACGEALIAGTYARGLLRSTDDGRTWSPVTEELRARSQQRGYLSFTAVACLPDGGVLAGTFWDGVFYSPDAGETWRDATAGLPSQSVQDFAVSPDGRVFVSNAAGVFVNVALPNE